MDAVYAKVFHVWVTQKLIRYSYKAYHEIVDKPSTLIEKLSVHFSPFALTIPFAVMTVIMHWFILAIIGVRIYVDNFSQEKIGRTQELQENPDTGEYRVAPLTRYMIFCGAYFPFASVLVYVLLNKYWFLEMYQVIGGKRKWVGYIPTTVKWFGFLADLKAYIAVILFMVPVIPFVVGAFLPDYNDSDFQVEPEVRAAAQILIICFGFTFLLPNIQASLIFTIILIIILLIVCSFLYAISETIEEICRPQKNKSTCC